MGNNTFSNRVAVVQVLTSMFCIELKTAKQHLSCRRLRFGLSNAFLKPFLVPLAVVATFGFSLISSAQDGRVTIIGELSDGTLPEPAPKPEFTPVEIRETQVVQLPDRKVTIHRIADPGLPDPRPKLPERPELNAEQIEAFRKSPAVQRWLKEVVVKTSHLFISATVVDEKFFRGSAVWLPSTQGEYKIKAAVVDSNCAVVASAIRRITIAQKQAPTISILSGPSNSSLPIPLNGSFDLDPGATVTRVDFYDHGTLIATAVQEEFENTMKDLQGVDVALLKGAHSIVVRAYDSTGAFTDTAPYSVTVTGGNARPEVNVTAPQSGLVVVEGDTFTIEYDPPTDADGFSDITSVRASRFIIPDAEGNLPRQPEETIAEDVTTPFEDLTVDTTGWGTGTYTIKVVAIDSSTQQSYHHYFRVEVKSSASADFAGDLFSEIADEQTLSLSNVKYVGREIASGIFQNGQSFVHSSMAQWQIDSGVLLTTGYFEFWDDGDFSDYKKLQLSARGDFDLENRVAGTQTQDAAVLEAEVYCENGQLEIEYQFGSDEYDEYVGDYNDSFMIIVDGSVVTRSPGCTDIFAVNTIHLNENRHLFMGDDEDIDPMDNLPNQLEYDGVTVRLRAHVFVEPQSTHNIRIVISDVDDGILDSGTFLETNSFRTVTPTP